MTKRKHDHEWTNAEEQLFRDLYEEHHGNLDAIAEHDDMPKVSRDALRLKYSEMTERDALQQQMAQLQEDGINEFHAKTMQQAKRQVEDFVKYQQGQSSIQAQGNPLIQAFQAQGNPQTHLQAQGIPQAQAHPHGHLQAQGILQAQGNPQTHLQAQGIPQAQAQAQGILQAQGNPQTHLQAQGIPQAQGHPHGHLQAQGILQAQGNPQAQGNLQGHPQVQAQNHNQLLQNIHNFVVGNAPSLANGIFGLIPNHGFVETAEFSDYWFERGFNGGERPTQALFQAFFGAFGLNVEHLEPALAAAMDAYNRGDGN